MNDQVSYNERFKKDWIDLVVNRLGLERGKYEDFLSKTFDDYNIETNTQIYNSFTHDTTSVDSKKFWYESPKDVIYGENGVMMWKTEKKESLVKVILSQNINVRQVFKKLKNKADSVGDKVNFDKYKTFESLCKLMINGYYGLSGYIAGAFFLLDAADLCTTGARNIIAVASLTNELLGKGFRNYSISAHMRIIEAAEEEYPKIQGKYTLPKVTTDQVLRHMLGQYYDNYYMKTMLTHKLESLSPEIHSFLYIKNNFTEFCKVPEVKVELEKAIGYLIKDNCIDIDESTGAKWINPYKHSGVKDSVKVLGEMITELAFGFHYYEGDYVNQVYQPTMVDIVSNIKRRKIGGMDTDSNITVLQQEKEFMLDYFKDIIGDKKDDEEFRECSLVLFITTMYLACIKRGLLEYTLAIGIDEQLSREYIDLECEMVMRNMQLTVNKKNYVFTTEEKDYAIKKSNGIRGLKFIKSDSNSSMSSMVEEDVFGKILIDQDKLNYGDLVMGIHKNTQSVIDMLKTPEFITEKKTVLKIADTTDIRFGDNRYKACRLWNKLFPDQEIELPGSFGMIRLNVNKDTLDLMRIKRPEVYKVFRDHAEEMFKFKIINAMISKLDKIYDEDHKDHYKTIKLIRSSSNECKTIIKTICKMVYHKYKKDQFHEGLYETVWNKVMNNNLSKQDLSVIKTVLGIGVKFNEAIHIPKNIDRLAVPLDINSVPPFISDNDYGILDVEIASEYEMLLSPLINTMSISVPKTKTKKCVMTSMLQVF